MIQCTFEDGSPAHLRHVTVGCIVTKDERILLAKRSEGLVEAGKWCFPGGFMNHGETAQMAMVREIMEETGWTLTDIQLLRINDSPNRPNERNRENVDFIFLATANQKTGGHDWETEAMEWFTLRNLPPDDQIAFDHLDSIMLYKKYIQKPFALPVVGGLVKS